MEADSHQQVVVVFSVELSPETQSHLVIFSVAALLLQAVVSLVGKSQLKAGPRHLNLVRPQLRQNLEEQDSEGLELQLEGHYSGQPVLRSQLLKEEHLPPQLGVDSSEHRSQQMARLLH